MTKRILLALGALLLVGAVAVGVALWFGGSSDPAPVPAAAKAPVVPEIPAASTAAPAERAPQPEGEPEADPAVVSERSPVERAADYGMTTREFVVARARAARLGAPQVDWQAGTFGGFDIVTLEPPSRQAYQKQVEIAKKIKELLKRDHVLATANPVVFYGGPNRNPDEMDVGEVAVPVLDGAKVTPPLKVRHLDPLKVWATEPFVEADITDAWGAAALARLKSAGYSFAEPQRGILRFEHPEPWTRDKHWVRSLMVVK